MAISAADLATVRRRSGDKPTPQDLTDVEIGAIYDDTTRGNLNLNRTTFYVLLERLGLATNAVDVTNPMGSITRNQKYQQIWKTLQTYSAITGIVLTIDMIGEGGFAEWGLYDV
jgi:hypothetical protein